MAFLFQSLHALKKKKKEITSWFLAWGLFLVSQFGSLVGRTASLGHGLSPLGSEPPRLCQGLNLPLPAHGILLQRLLTAILGHQKYLKHTRSVRQNLHLRKIVPFQHFHSKILFFLFNVKANYSRVIEYPCLRVQSAPCTCENPAHCGLLGF